jgi:hypothetical protein
LSSACAIFVKDRHHGVMQTEKNYFL